MKSKLKHVLKSPLLVDYKHHSILTYYYNIVQANLVSKIVFFVKCLTLGKNDPKSAGNFFLRIKRG